MNAPSSCSLTTRARKPRGAMRPRAFRNAALPARWRRGMGSGCMLALLLVPCASLSSRPPQRAISRRALLSTSAAAVALPPFTSNAAVTPAGTLAAREGEPLEVLACTSFWRIPFECTLPRCADRAACSPKRRVLSMRSLAANRHLRRSHLACVHASLRLRVHLPRPHASHMLTGVVAPGGRAHPTLCTR